MSEVLRELREQESRKNNIVIHNMMESNKGTAMARKENDIVGIEELASTISVQFNRDRIKFMKRLGEKKEGKTRPLLVGFKNFDTKEEFLEQAKLLDQEEDSWRDVYLCPDLTFKQREEDERIRKEAEKLNSEHSEADVLNFEFRLVGRKGQKRMVKASVRQTPIRGEPSKRGTRGGGRGRGNRGGRM